MVKVVIQTSKKYGSYLSKHLQKEHPKTKGKILVTEDDGICKYRAWHHLGTTCKYCGQKG